MARWSQRRASRERLKRRGQGVVWGSREFAGAVHVRANVAYVEGFDGFSCRCEVHDESRYLVCLSCGCCEECCRCVA
jgi:hypothetical protein